MKKLNSTKKMKNKDQKGRQFMQKRDKKLPLFENKKLENDYWINIYIQVFAKQFVHDKTRDSASFQDIPNNESKITKDQFQLVKKQYCPRLS